MMAMKGGDANAGDYAQTREEGSDRQGQLRHLRLTVRVEAGLRPTPTRCFWRKTMECGESSDRLRVETDLAIYEIQFGQVQVEITGRCNMGCEHCRAAHDLHKDMPLGQIVKVIQFARRYSPSHKEFVVSGGEPLMHTEFAQVLEAVRGNGGDSLPLRPTVLC